MASRSFVVDVTVTMTTVRDMAGRGCLVRVTINDFVPVYISRSDSDVVELACA